MCRTRLICRFPVAGEAVADLVAGGGVDRVRCRSRTRSGPWSGKRVMSPTSTSSRAAPEGPMPVRSSRPVPVAVRSSVSSLFGGLLARVDPLEVADQLRGDAAGGSSRRRRGGGPSRAGPWPGGPRGPSSHRRGSARAAAGAAGRPSGCGPHPSASAPVDQDPQHRELLVVDRPDAGRPSECRPAATEWASVASVLRPCPVANTRARADNFGGTSTTSSPSASSRWAMCLPMPAQPSTAQTRSRPLPGRSAASPS